MGNGNGDGDGDESWIENMRQRKTGWDLSVNVDVNDERVFSRINTHFYDGRSCGESRVRQTNRKTKSYKVHPLPSRSLGFLSSSSS